MTKNNSPDKKAEAAASVRLDGQTFDADEHIGYGHFSQPPANKPDQSIVKRQLEGEVKEYDQYLTGDIYGFILRGPKEKCDKCGHTAEGEDEDSCWGFYGSDPFDNGMLENFTGDIQKEMKEKYGPKPKKVEEEKHD